MVVWSPWGAAAFERAAREGKPVLLSITAAWCRACREMDRTTYADARVAALIAEGFVPVRVDTDRRPDINDRYNLGGWPTTAFLTADGRLLTGGTFVAADRMPGVLARVAGAFAARAQFRSSAPAPDAAPDADARDVDDEAGQHIDGAPVGEVSDLLDVIFSTFDPDCGGFGVEPKFPHAAPLHLALALFRETAEPRWRTIVERTLDGMWDLGLWDRTDGGFFRCSTRDWQRLRPEKLLETNASLLAAYADAALVLGRPADCERTEAVAQFIRGPLRHPAGGYCGSDADRALYADGNGAAASALLRAAAALDDSALAREALASFERVLLACYRPGAGVAHCADDGEGVRGLLADQVAALAALLDAHDATDGEPYQMMAEEIGHYLVGALWDEAAGGFFDRAPQPDDVGLLRTRRKPFVGNAEAASALARLQRVSREGDFARYAAGALTTAAAQAGAQGPLAAHYVLAARRLG